jgi:hypothetical protein
MGRGEIQPKNALRVAVLLGGGQQQAVCSKQLSRLKSGFRVLE